MVCACAFLAIGAGSIGAATLEIQLAGLDLTYDGNALYDATSINGRAANPAEADPLLSMHFLVNGSPVGTLTSDVYADVYVDGLTNCPATGGMATTSGQGDTFGIDLMTNSSNPSGGLSLNIDQFQMFYAGNEVSMAATGVASSVALQNLPFGFEFDVNEPITIILSSAHLTNVTTAGGFLTGFNSSGTGNIAGVPEPVSLMLLGVGGLVILRRRKA
jgi:hypothetical protein